MTGLAVAVATWLFLMLPVWAICTMSKRADERDEARRRHPSNAKPQSCTCSNCAEWDGIVQAVDIFDDGKALVRETEAFLKWSADA